MVIVACVIDDGRPEYLAETVASLSRVSPIDVRVIIDDTGDPAYAEYLDRTYSDFDHQVHHATRRGLGGAVRSAWTTALGLGADYVWHQEDDQVVLADVDLNGFVGLLETQPQLAQVTLKRTLAEHPSGGVVEANPDHYWERCDKGMTWTATDHLFMFCPSLIPRRVIECALASTDVFLEREVTDALWAHGYHSCLWGAKYDPPLCAHVGTVRSGGYHW